jgi:uncharacterized membrane protein YkoI
MLSHPWYQPHHEMKKTLCLLAVGLLILSSSVILVSAAGKEKGAKEQSVARGSIRVKGQPSAVERAALAKISFQDALAAAVAAYPGKVISGELGVEDGNLQYDFEIIGADKKVMDVAIDAGNGKVLDIDESDED